MNVVRELINKGGNIKVKAKNGETPLHRASEEGRLDVVKFLVANKANINAKNNNEQSPLHISIADYHTDVAEYLRSKGRVE